MKIYGTFTDISGADVTVTIDATDADGADIEIGATGAGVWFNGDSPVKLERKCDNTTDVILSTGCTIRLLTASHLAALYQRAPLGASVMVTRAGVTLFRGWVVPRSYTQEYDDELDTLDVECTDALGALQYFKFRDVRTSDDFKTVRRAAGTASFLELITEALAAGTGGLDDFAVYYDNSRRLATDATASVLSELSVSCVPFLGDDEDSVKDYAEVLTEVLTYLNAHITQDGAVFHIFNWQTLRGGAVAWEQVLGGGTDSPIEQTAAVSVSSAVPATGATASLPARAGATVDILESFNQICLTVSPTESTNVISSPLDSTALKDVGSRFRYATEYAADGKGVKASRAYWELINNSAEDSEANKNAYEEERVHKDFYLKLRRHDDWTFGRNGEDWATGQERADKCEVVDRLATEVPSALLLAVGEADYKPGKGDTNPQASLSFTDRLVISVGGFYDIASYMGKGNPVEEGNYYTGTTPASTISPLTEEAVRAAAPLCRYTGGGDFTTYTSEGGGHNYLVISGTVCLCPPMFAQSDYQCTDVILELSAWNVLSTGGDDYTGTRSGDYDYWPPSRNNDDGRYFTMNWWREGGATLITPKPAGGFPYYTHYAPYTADGAEMAEYAGSGTVATDNLSHVPVLLCMLMIGEKGARKCLVRKEGSVSHTPALTWQDFVEREDCADDDTYFAQSFTLGIDPVVGDKLVGTEFNFATNYDYRTGINADGGFAIPLFDPDGGELTLAGPIEFQIVGPYVNVYMHKSSKSNKMIDDVIDVSASEAAASHPGYTPLAAFVDSIIVKTLEIKAVSDVTEDSETYDLVYMSQADADFYNKKEGLTFSLHSGFTAAERAKFALTDKLFPSTVMGPDGAALLRLADTSGAGGGTRKAEELYVSELYDELHVPRLRLTQGLRFDAFSPFGLYTEGTLGKTFLPTSWQIDVRNDYVTAVMSETF